MVVRFGKYVLLKRIAVGGMAELFLARQVGAGGFEKLVVVKRILEHLSSDQDFVEMFLNEGRLASSLNHPNVVQVYDLGQESGAYYMAMEFIAGHDLYNVARKAAQQSAPIPPEIAARILLGACAGLHYAHNKKNLQGQPLNIVHRDVSPANILVSYEGEVKVTDFGIAKADAHGARTRTGVLKGKFSYMSPEQIRSEPLDGRSDVFALGITLHETLTARRLFRRDSELAVMHDLLEMEVPRPSSLRPGLPEALDAICLRALERDLDRRYPSAQAMQRDLEAYLASSGKPAGAVEVSTFMLQRFAEEHAAYQELLAQLGTADPNQLAMFLEENSALARNSPLDGTGSDKKEEPLAAASSSSTPGPAAAPRKRSRGPLVAGGVLVAGIAAAAAVGVLFLRGPPPPPAFRGSLQVETDPPGARIVLDGTSTGLFSPATLSPIFEPGQHQLRLEKDGFQPKEIAVVLAGDAPDKAVSVSLLPVPPPPPPAPPPPLAEEMPPAKDPEPEPPALARGRPGASMGTLQLSSDPATEVLYQRRALGKTPAKLRLPIGKVELTLVNRELSLTRKVEVEVPARGVGAKEITFGKGKLAADVKPWADVYVGARKLGTTPLSPRELYEGTYVVKLVNSELGAIKEVKVTVAPGSTTVLREELP